MVSFVTNSRTKPAMASAVRFALLCYLIIGICNFHSVICKSDQECKSETEFKCLNGPTLCIPIERVRDGVPDCPDLSDEACSNDEFKCKGSQECIPKQRVLDGTKDCSDGSDEECQRDQFPCRCGVPRCVNLESVKDGVRNCADGSDEGEGPDTDSGCPDDSLLQDLKGVDRQKRQVGGAQTEIPRRFQPEATPNYGLPAQDGGAAPAAAYDQYERFQSLRESAVRQPAHESSDDNATPLIEQPVTRNGPRRSVLRRVRPTADLQRLRQPAAASRPNVVRRTRVRNHSEHRETDHLDSEIQPTPVAYYPTETTDSAASEEEDTYSLQPPVVDYARLDSAEPTRDDYPATEATNSETTAQSENEASRNGGANKPVRRIIRLRRPEASSSNPRKKILVSRRLINGQVASETLQGRGPVNGLGNAVEDSVAHDLEAYTTSPVPLTYYTTYTYYTTFLDGPNTIYTSREAVVSSVATQTIDPDTARVIQSFGGYTNDPSADAVIPLGSRAFGPTTTVVNLASRIQLYNDDVYSGVINTIPFEEATPTQAFSSSVVSVPVPRYENSGEDSDHETKHVSELATLPKTFYTLFTYYYTFYDGDSTRQSVRAETVSSVQSEPSVALGQPVNNYIDNQGLLTVGPETKIIPLGSREVAGTTTEVNLGMRTIVHFDGVSNVVVQRPDIQPTESYQNLPSATYTLPDNQLGFIPDSQPQYVQPGYAGPSVLQPSYSAAYDDYSNVAPVSAYESTPLIPQGDPALSTQPIDRRPFRVISSFVQNPGGNLQSRPFLNRPGVRVRVRPISSRRVPLPSSSFVVPLYESSVIVPPNQFLDLNDQNRQPVINEQPVLGEPQSQSLGTPNLLEGSVTYPNVQPIGEVPSDLNDQFPNHGGRQATPPEESGRPGGRRRLKITVRRPNAIGNITKTNTRFVRPSRFEITSSKPRIYVVTRTGHQGGHVKPSRVPVSVKINRRPKPEGEEDDLPTGRTEYETYTTLTTVPVIFGLETSYRSLLLTTSSAVVVPEDSPSFAQPSIGDVQPTRAVVFTYFTTTTYTVPFTVGDQTLLTTLEETNSRIVTQTIDVEASPTASIPIPDVTSYEYGSQGHTTHIISSRPDGTTTSTVLYPGPDGTIRGTKVIRVDANGVGFTSMYGSVPENIIPSSAGAQPPQTLPPIQVYGPYQSLGEQPIKSSYITRISDGVTLILASEAPTTQYYPQPSTALTLQPSLVTDAILMKEKEPLDPSLTVVHNTRTFYTTYTYFTTFFSDSTSTISSSEQVVSNVVTETVTQRITPTVASPLPPRSEIGPYQSLPITVTETSDRLVTSTALSTYTIYATLFNGSSSFVTPLEEVHTQVYTITEPITFTRVIEPTSTVSLEPSTFEVTSTYYTTYTNFVTFLEGPNTVVSSIEETVSSVETLTLFGTRPTATPALSSEITPTTSTYTTKSDIPVYTTKTYFTTQTHYITLFSGSETILSSIEEAGTKVVTERVDETPSVSSPYYESTAIFTKPSFESEEPTSSITASTVKVQDGDDGGVQLQTSVRTIYTTFTYYTTYFSDTATLVSSREVISTSHVTLFIPKTSTLSTAPISIPTTASAISPTASGSFTTTTEYSTLTLFTTLFDGKEQVVISSEHVIPEVKTSTLTAAPVRPEPSPTVERIHTHYTTYTFYDTTVKGSETILTPSESIITNYVTASGVEDSSEVYSVSSSPVKDVEIVNVETRVESSVQRSSVVVDRSSEIRTEVGIILPSSTDSGPSIVVVGGQSDTDIDSSQASEPFLSGTSTTVIDGSTVIFFTNFDAFDVKPSKASTQESTTETTTVSVSEDTTTTDSAITTITTTEATTTDAETTSQSSKTTTEYSKDKPVSGATPPLKEAVTRTKVITASTHFVGIDKETTSLTPNATLLVVTGTDGSTTNLVHAEITPYADGINPSLTLDEELPSSSVSSKPTIKPGSVIELSDLLGGNSNLGGNIGEAIKGIVNLITAGQKKNETKEDESKIPEKDQPPLPPREGVTVSRQEEPVYIPIGAIGRESEVSDLTPVFKPIDELSERTNDKGDLGSQPSFSPGTLVKGFTPFADGDVTPVAEVDVVSKGIEIAPTRPGAVSPTELVLGPSFGGSTELSGSIHTDRSDSESSSQPTPAIQGTSVITGAKTIFLGGLGIRPGSKDSTAGTIFFSKGQPSRAGAPKQTSIFDGEFTPLATSKQKSNDYTTITKGGQTIVSKTSSGATTIFYPFGNSNFESSKPTEASMTTTTKYVTRVESLTRTLTLTTTKIYYTRDSPITITSVFTTTIPPRTFVSTIVGSRTILGNFPEPTETVHIQPSIQPSESTTTVTTTTKIFNDITTTFVRTLVIPTKATKVAGDTHTAGGPHAKSDVEILEAGTERPPGPPPSADSTAVTHSGHHNSGQPKFSFGPRTTPRSPLGNRKPIVLFKPNQRPTDPTTTKPPFTGAKPKLSFPTRAPTTTAAPTTRRPPRPKYVPKKNRENEITGCDPECDATKKEICRKNEYDVWACECKTGFARKEGSKICEEIETYVVLLRVVKKGESAVSYRTQFSNSLSTEYQELSEMAKKGINEAYKKSDVAENFVGADVLSISDGKDLSSPDLDVSDSEPVGILVNFTVQVAKGTPLGETQLKEELSRSLKQSNFSVGGTELYVDPQKQVVEDVQDFDECRDESYNDCSGSAICSNLVGSYNCTCKEYFQDLDSSSPGRVCSGELKSCDYCNGRGDCIASEDSKRTCKCHRMYIGRRCEINGLVLAIALPLAAAFVIFLVCCFFCCCRRYRREKRKKTKAGNVFKGMGLINPLTGTLDKKAMIMDTSSESSGDHPVRPPPPPPPPHAFDNFGAESDMTPKKGSKKSDLSLDRSLSTGFSVPPVVIPRARHQHPKQVNYPNMYGGQAFLQW